MRKLRYAPEGGATFEVTCRTLQARLLLRPSPELNQIIAGILGRAQRLYGVTLYCYAFISNHTFCCEPGTLANSPDSWAISTRTWRGR